jgi:hypothetical protein
LVLTAVVSMAGFPIFAQESLAGSPGPLWGFSHGINATFQFEVAETRPATVILETPIEKEFGAVNGEGVDVFTEHGTKKQQLVLTIYSSIHTCPHWIRREGKKCPVEGFDRGMVARLHARMSNAWTGESVKVMEWHLYQVNRAAFNGDNNAFRHQTGATLDLSFEADERPE